MLVWNVWNALVGAVTCAAAGAMQMDCIPVQQPMGGCSAAPPFNFASRSNRNVESAFAD